jgi:hypothetical protein
MLNKLFLLSNFHKFANELTCKFLNKLDYKSIEENEMKLIILN